MKNINKSTVGLGKVINRLQVDQLDWLTMLEKLTALKRDNVIEGTWDSITANSKVKVVSSGLYDINLDNNAGVIIVVNRTSQMIRLSGGLNGETYYFMFKNLADHSVEWDNVRARDAEAPELSSTNDPANPSVTTMSLCKVGNEYYITDVNVNVY